MSALILVVAILILFGGIGASFRCNTKNQDKISYQEVISQGMSNTKVSSDTDLIRVPATNDDAVYFSVTKNGLMLSALTDFLNDFQGVAITLTTVPYCDSFFGKPKNSIVGAEIDKRRALELLFIKKLFSGRGHVAVAESGTPELPYQFTFSSPRAVGVTKENGFDAPEAPVSLKVRLAGSPAIDTLIARNEDEDREVIVTGTMAYVTTHHKELPDFDYYYVQNPEWRYSDGN